MKGRSESGYLNKIIIYNEQNKKYYKALMLPRCL